eukprot:TRINITY_DN12214_c0_g5_i2.p1 TRINITY_DN12214_c0_g5~~TRINITY_DN12214_c0_g5_i2.p1  ORF type:complete len:519 (+),score=93.09 TRINITY_DN12214_c0_g5_i2:97-1557(+)
MEGVPPDLLKHIISRLTSHADKLSVAAVSKGWFRLSLEVWPRVRLLSGHPLSSSPSGHAPLFPTHFEEDEAAVVDSWCRANRCPPREPLAWTHGKLLSMLCEVPILSLSLPEAPEEVAGQHQSIRFTQDDILLIAEQFGSLQSLTVPGPLEREALAMLGAMGGGRSLKRLSLGSLIGGKLWNSAGQQEDMELVGMLDGFEGLEELQIVEAWPYDVDNGQGANIYGVLKMLTGLKKLDLTVFVQWYWEEMGSLFCGGPWPKDVELHLKLHFSDAADSFKDIAEDLAEASPTLTELAVTGPADRFSHDSLPIIFKNCPELRRLHLDAYGAPEELGRLCRFPGDVGLHFSKAPSRLEELECLGLFLEEAGMKAIATGCSDLKVLSLRCRRPISGTGLATLLASCPNLQKLIFSGPSISFLGMQSTPEHPAIREMELRCKHLPLDSLRSLAELCPNLKQLKVHRALNTHLREMHLDLIRSSLRRGQLVIA